MTDGPRIGARAQCAACGAPVDPLRAPAVRMTSRGVLVYCSALHRELPLAARPLRTPPTPEAPDVESIDGRLLDGPDTPEESLGQDAFGQGSLGQGSLGQDPLGPGLPGRVAALHSPAPVRTPAPHRSVERAAISRRIRATGLLLVWLGLVTVLLAVAGLRWSRGQAIISELALAGIIAVFALAG